MNQIKPFVRTHYRGVLVVFVLLSIVLDLGRMWAKPFDLTSGQTESWWEIAHKVEAGIGYKSCNLSYVPNCELTDQRTAIREPIPVLFFALVGKLTQDSLIAFQVVQILFYLLILWGTFLLGRKISGLDIGLLAAFFWTIYLPQEHLEMYLTGDMLAGVFFVFGALFFVDAVRENRWRDWLGFGVLMGLAILSRSAMLVVAGGLILGYGLLNLKTFFATPVKLLQKPVAALVVMVLVVSPWMIRNYLVFRQPIFGTTLVGYNMYRHNAIVATDAPPHYVGPDEALQEVQTLVQQTPELSTPLNEAQVDAVFRQETIKLIRAHPFKYAELVMYRVLPLWFNIGVREQYGKDITILDNLIVLQQFILLIALIVGLMRNDKLLRIFGIGTLIYGLSFLAVDSQLRYLVPVMPVLIVIGCLGGIDLWQAFARRRKIALPDTI